MYGQRVLLVNPNTVQPPVSPVAIDYLGQTLRDAGFGVDFLDLAFSRNVDGDLNSILSEEYLLVGVTVRNVDDSCFATGEFTLEHTRSVIELIKRYSEAPVVVGGAGFSIFGAPALDYCGADIGVVGDGETSLSMIAESIADGHDYSTLPGVVLPWHETGDSNPPVLCDLASIDLSARDTVDNVRYFDKGGMVGFETSRGCDQACAYCADPVCKGNRIRLRRPENVAREIENLLLQGVTHFHTCDSEFNVSIEHAIDVCQAIREKGLSDHIWWYAYASPVPFTDELARAMKEAGCGGIDFGADHADPEMLHALGREYGPDDLREVARLCHKYEIPFMFDLLLGGPGETWRTVEETIEFMRRVDPSRVGVSVGVRLYPGTPLVETLAAKGEFPAGAGIHRTEHVSADLLRPTYYLSPALRDYVYERVADMIGDDPRFFVGGGTSGIEDYNYNDNAAIVRAIENGYRGAFWDILRRVREDADEEEQEPI